MTPLEHIEAAEKLINFEPHGDNDASSRWALRAQAHAQIARAQIQLASWNELHAYQKDVLDEHGNPQRAPRLSDMDTFR